MDQYESYLHGFWVIIPLIYSNNTVLWAYIPRIVYAPLSFSDGANATTQKLQNTKAGGSRSEY